MKSTVGLTEKPAAAPHLEATGRRADVGPQWRGPPDPAGLFPEKLDSLVGHEGGHDGLHGRLVGASGSCTPSSPMP